MDQQQYVRICEQLGDIMRKLETIEMQIENRTLQFLIKRRELKLEDNKRAYESRHGVLETANDDAEDEID